MNICDRGAGSDWMNSPHNNEEFEVKRLVATVVSLMGLAVAGCGSVPAKRLLGQS